MISDIVTICGIVGVPARCATARCAAPRGRTPADWIGGGRRSREVRAGLSGKYAPCDASAFIWEKLMHSVRQRDYDDIQLPMFLMVSGAGGVSFKLAIFDGLTMQR